jgi:protein involved in polysaccharide export with SLBB domain
MIKLILLVAVVVVLSPHGSYGVLGQTQMSQPESLSSGHPGDLSNASPPSSISPEARAEARRLYKQGVKYGHAKLFPQAAELFERVLKLDPDFSDAYYSLGHAYFDMRQWKAAIYNLQRAVELNPKDREAHDRLAQANLMNERYGAAEGTELSEAKNPPAPGGAKVSLNLNVPSPSIKSSGTDEAAADELSLTKTYRVGPGDVLDVRLKETESQSTLFTVNASGLLEYPLLTDAMHVSGLTAEEISRSIETELRRQQLAANPKVIVGVRDYASHTILVSGLVKDPGTKILRREAIPLYVVVADAQPLPEAAKVTVIRNESKQTFEIELTQAQDMNILIRSGDVITLHANAAEFIYVAGEVKSPGEITFRRGLTLTQAMIAAGGAIANPKEARIGRDDGHGFLTTSRFNLKDIESGKIPDPLVRPGDRITILR